MGSVRTYLISPTFYLRYLHIYIYIHSRTVTIWSTFVLTKYILLFDSMRSTNWLLGSWRLYIWQIIQHFVVNSWHVDSFDFEYNSPAVVDEFGEIFFEGWKNIFFAANLQLAFGINPYVTICWEDNRWLNFFWISCTVFTNLNGIVWIKGGH